MVYMEMGVAFLPSLYIRSEILDRDELSVHSITGEKIERMHALVWRDSSPLRGFYRELGGFIQGEIERQFGGDVGIL
jgi:LysR family hydrogen peroxide-inducible transcriptional activator